MYHHHSRTYLGLSFMIVALTKISNATGSPRPSWSPSSRIMTSLSPNNIVRNENPIMKKMDESPLSNSRNPESSLRLHQMILSIKGGSQTVSEKSIIVDKLRNVVRSIVRITERRAPATAKLVKQCVAILEKLSGLELLSKEDEITAKLKNRKKKKKKIKVSAESDQESKIIANSGIKKTISSTASISIRPSSTAKSHLSKPLKRASPNYRIQRELKQFLTSPPPNLSLKVGKNIRVWIVTLSFPPNTVYHGEKYRLRIQFPQDYPTSPPSVYFLQPTPRHEHVYTNGDICLSLLGNDWRPTMTAQSVAMSILSILSGAQRKSLPMDNVRHSGSKPGGKQDDWVYHDDNC